MKKITSFGLKNSLLKTFMRFPFTIVYSFLLSFIIIIMISSKDDASNTLLKISNILFTGIIYSIVCTIFSEALKNNKSAIYNIILLVFMLLYYFFFPVDEAYKYIYKTIIIDLVGILAISFLPFYTKNKQNEFWLYNSKILFKLLLTSIYVSVIIIGISIAFGIFTNLIGAQIHSEIYFDFSVFTIGFFGTIFFLTNFPKNYNEDLTDFKYPKAIKILVFYILLPLTTIYFAILYLYFFKIILQWHIPAGSVSYMILIFSVLGILSLMSVYPIRNSLKNKGIAVFSKYFFYAILPLIILLFISIFIRVKDYGITENRYYVILFAFWLSGISIYMIINKLRDIKIIPISLFFVLLLTGFGPWSAFNVSKMSQLHKLNKIISQNNLFPADKTAQKNEIPDSIYNEIYNISHYIIVNHGSKILAKKYNLDLSMTDSTDDNKTHIFLDSLKIFSANKSNYNNFQYFSIYNDSKIIDIKNYDLYINNYYSYMDTEINDSINVDFNRKNFILKVQIGKRKASYNIKKQLIDIVRLNKKKDNLNTKEYEINLPKENNIIIKLIVLNFNGDYSKKEIKNYSLTMGILIKIE